MSPIDWVLVALWLAGLTLVLTCIGVLAAERMQTVMRHRRGPVHKPRYRRARP
ncbi:MAG TPA: hypothetical protein VGC45_13365 [Gryllotalpicola sp.]